MKGLKKHSISVLRVSYKTCGDYSGQNKTIMTNKLHVLGKRGGTSYHRLQVCKVSPHYFSFPILSYPLLSSPTFAVVPEDEVMVTATSNGEQASVVVSLAITSADWEVLVSAPTATTIVCWRKKQ